MSRAGLLRALASVVAAPSALDAVADALELPRVPSRTELTDTFVLQLHPYASVHLGDEGHLGGEARDRIAGFLRALDVVPPPEPDHLAVLLDASASLADLEAAGSERAAHARAVLLHEHLGSWVGRFLERVVELAAPPLVRWAELTLEVLADELARTGPAEVLPLALRAAGDLPDPRVAGPDGFVPALLAPVRSGIVLARADLARAAEDVGVGVRVGERAFLLRAMIDQDPVATLAWLSGEARRQGASTAASAAVGGTDVAGWWAARAASTADLLDTLAREGGRDELAARLGGSAGSPVTAGGQG